MAKARLIVDLDIKPDQVESFVDMFRKEFISRSRSENGCELYDLWQDPEHPEKLAIVEIWTSQGHLDAHLAQPWFAEWAPRMESAQAAPMRIRALRSVED